MSRLAKPGEHAADADAGRGKGKGKAKAGRSQPPDAGIGTILRLFRRASALYGGQQSQED
jgi:hypothetical protein